jgi:hypothetical protein
MLYGTVHWRSLVIVTYDIQVDRPGAKFDQCPTVNGGCFQFPMFLQHRDRQSPQPLTYSLLITSDTETHTTLATFEQLISSFSKQLAIQEEPLHNIVNLLHIASHPNEIIDGMIEKGKKN